MINNEEWDEIYICNCSNGKYKLLFNGINIKCNKNNFSSVLDKVLEDNLIYPVLTIHGFNVCDCLKFAEMKYIDRIKMLYIERIDIPDLEFLKYFSGVEHFWFAYNCNSNCQPFGIDLNGIRYLENLRSLELAELFNSTSNLGFVKNLKMLEAIDIYRVNLYNANELYGNEKIKYLRLEGCCTDFNSTILKKMPALEFLSLSPEKRHVSLEEIPEDILKGLRYLCLSFSNISDISKLEVAENLEYLNLQFNNISDVSPITKMKRLKKLILTMNPIQNFSSLENLNSLVELLVDNDFVSDEEIFERFPALQSLNFKDCNGQYKTVYDLSYVKSQYVKTNAITKNKY